MERRDRWAVNGEAPEPETWNSPHGAALDPSTLILLSALACCLSLPHSQLASLLRKGCCYRSRDLPRGVSPAQYPSVPNYPVVWYDVGGLKYNGGRGLQRALPSPLARLPRRR